MSDHEQENLNRDASQIGMWIFLATEVMFFGGLFTAYSAFHYRHADAFASAGGHTDLWMGAVNTAVLLLSSLTMALAVEAARGTSSRSLLRYLLATIGLGSIFLVLKGIEYVHHINEHLFPGPTFDYSPNSFRGPAELFFYLYFTMTGLHALHMIIGILVLVALAVLAKHRAGGVSDTAVTLTGLYWHFVDVIWIFLFPMFYLVRSR